MDTYAALLNPHGTQIRGYIRVRLAHLEKEAHDGRAPVDDEVCVEVAAFVLSSNERIPTDLDQAGGIAGGSARGDKESNSGTRVREGGVPPGPILA